MRGIQEIKRTNKDGSTITRYRVQINRKDFKQDKLFDDEKEAIEFFNACKSMTGKNKIKLLEEQKKTELKIIQDFIKNPTFAFFIDKYIEDYVKPKYKNYDPETAFGKFKLTNFRTTKTYYNMIKKTLIDERTEEEFEISPSIFEFMQGKKPLGDFKPQKITDIEINNYIKQRLRQGLKPISIQREITFISVVFKKLRYLDPKLKDIKNPCLEYDKDLLKQFGELVPRNTFRFTDEEKQKLLKGIEEYENPELGYIIKLMLFTAMRRSEAVLLNWSQVHENYLHLINTKANKPRFVYLTQEAKELLKTIPKVNGDRLFKYTVAGFDISLRNFLKNIGIKAGSHSFRKEAISYFISEIGASNSLMIAEFLGLSVGRLQEKINNDPENSSLQDQQSALKSFGHSKPSTTQRHYFSFKEDLKND